MFGACVSAAGGAGARNYTGSDSLRDFTLTLVTQCGAINGGTSYPALAGASPQYAYLGGGSGPGAVDMRNGEQDIAPMTRPLNASEACEAVIEANPSTGAGNLGNDEAAVTISPPGSRAEGLVIGVDGLSIAVAPASGARCDPTPADGFAAPLAYTSNKTFPVTNFTTNVSDSAPNISTFQDLALPAPGGALEAEAGGALLYRFLDFKDVLRILFAGADRTRTASAAAGGGGGNTQSAANRLSRCSSDIRRSLVAHLPGRRAADPGPVPDPAGRARDGDRHGRLGQLLESAAQHLLPHARRQRRPRVQPRATFERGESAQRADHGPDRADRHHQRHSPHALSQLAVRAGRVLDQPRLHRRQRGLRARLLR